MLYFICTVVVLNIFGCTCISANLAHSEQICEKNPTCDVIKNDKLIIQKKKMATNSSQKFSANDANSSHASIDIHPENLEASASFENGEK
jgi:hypothetical protein